MEQVFIYNPRYGTSDDIKQQLVFSYGANALEEALRQIGVAQGIIEVNSSFDKGSTATSVQTRENMMLIKKLEDDQDGDWRNGFWALIVVKLSTAQWDPASLSYALVNCYDQWVLFNGALADSTKTGQQKGRLESWWSRFCRRWEAYCSPSVPLREPFLHLAPGTLDPKMAQLIERVKSDHALLDLLVMETADYSYLWMGNSVEVPVSAKSAVQNWLYGKSSLKPVDDIEGISDSNDTHLSSGWQPHPHPLDAEPQETLEPENSIGISGYTTHYLRKFQPVLPSIIRPLSFPVRSVTSRIQFPYWNSPAAHPPLDIGTRPQDTHQRKDANVETEQPVFVGSRKTKMLLWENSGLVFIIFADADSTNVLLCELEGSLGELSKHINGFSFAFFAYVPFFFAVVDHERKTVCSNYSTKSSKLSKKDQSMLSTVARAAAGGRMCGSLSTLRTSKSWLVSSEKLGPGVFAVFWKKWHQKGNQCLLGNFEKDTRSWLDNFERITSSSARDGDL